MAPSCGVIDWNVLRLKVGPFSWHIPTSDFDLEPPVN